MKNFWTKHLKVSFFTLIGMAIMAVGTPYKANANGAPSVTSSTDITYIYRERDANTFIGTIDVSDPDGDPFRFFLDGRDADLFVLFEEEEEFEQSPLRSLGSASSYGLFFKNIPDEGFNEGEEYEFNFNLNDGTNTVSIPFTITIALNQPPTITSPTNITFVQGSDFTNITTVVASDPEGDPIGFFVQSGENEEEDEELIDDADLFTIGKDDGVLRFNTKFAPDFNNPIDVNGDNVYEFTVVAFDGSDASIVPFTVTVVQGLSLIHISEPTRPY